MFVRVFFVVIKLLRVVDIISGLMHRLVWDYDESRRLLKVLKRNVIDAWTRTMRGPGLFQGLNNRKSTRTKQQA